MKKFFISIGTLIVGLLAIAGYQFANSGKLPNLEVFAKNVTCTKVGNTVTVTATTGEQVVITFPTPISERGTPAEPTSVLYYEKAPTKNAKSTPLSLLANLEKYQFIVNFARDCLMDFIPLGAAGTK